METTKKPIIIMRVQQGCCGVYFFYYSYLGFARHRDALAGTCPEPLPYEAIAIARLARADFGGSEGLHVLALAVAMNGRIHKAEHVPCRVAIAIMVIFAHDGVHGHTPPFVIGEGAQRDVSAALDGRMARRKGEGARALEEAILHQGIGKRLT